MVHKKLKLILVKPREETGRRVTGERHWQTSQQRRRKGVWIRWEPVTHLMIEIGTAMSTTPHTAVIDATILPAVVSISMSP
jgi:hypothetical protein